VRFAIARPLALLIVLALLGLVGLCFHELAKLRADAVTQGPAKQVTARYQAPDRNGSMLAPGSDTGLRVKVRGDLATATNIAVLVPGMGHTAQEFDHPSLNQDDLKTNLAFQANALWNESADPDHLAVIAWLGYHPPDVFQALAGRSIDPGAANLVALEDFLAVQAPQAKVTWLCHSYGSLVCGAALKQASPRSVVMLGSPGVQADKVAQLGGSAKIYAARGDSDAIVLAGLMDLTGGGFGPDPTDQGFGADKLPCSPGTGHSDYFRPGSPQLKALVEVVEGRYTAA
jgi:hypothetical protein